MKKLFTLVSVALAAMTVNAQTTWTDQWDMTYTDAETADAAGVVSSDATSSVISAQTTNITFRAVSSPNQNQIDDGETYWQVQSRENRYLNDGNPAYQHGYLLSISPPKQIRLKKVKGNVFCPSYVQTSWPPRGFARSRSHA